MKLTKENVYISLRGKNKEELTDLYNFLKSVGEKQFRDSLNDFLNSWRIGTWIAYELTTSNNWVFSSNEHSLSKKTEVTIKQLKEILQPMDLTLEQQLQKAEAEVKRLKEAIEDSRIKAGDWVVIKETATVYKVNDKDIGYMDDFHIKIQNPELIKLLEQEIK